jgi:hypothetical protein
VCTKCLQFFPNPKGTNDVGILETSIPNAAHQIDAITISKSIPFLNIIASLNSLLNSKPTLYADDCNAQICSDTNDNLKAKIIEIIPQLEHWFSENGLLMNRKKTEIMAFNPIQYKHPLTGIISADDDDFLCATSTKFLGVYVDKNLRWTAHTDHLRKKLPSVIFALTHYGRN